MFVDSLVPPREAVSPGTNLRAHGIDHEQAADLRAPLVPFAEDWEQPEMDIYDDYDAAEINPSSTDTSPHGTR